MRDNFATVIWQGDNPVYHRKMEHVPSVCLWRCQFPVLLSRVSGTSLMFDIQRERVSEIMSLTEAEARDYPTIDTRACFRNFVTILRANPAETRKHRTAENRRISAVCGSCTCSWQDWRQAIEITNGPAPLVPSALCNNRLGHVTPFILHLC